MELLHSQEAAKKLCHFLRLAFCMVIKKGLIISRKKLMIMGLILKRGKLLGKTMKNLLLIINHPRGKALPPPTRSMEYEFSCSNTPNIISFKSRSKRRGNMSSLFSCLNAGCCDESSVAPVFVFPALEYSPRCVYGSSFVDGGKYYKERWLGPSPSRSPFLVRVSGCSSEAEEEEEEEEVECDVDDKAEEFIERFYEELRAQSFAPILA